MLKRSMLTAEEALEGDEGGWPQGMGKSRGI